MPDTLAKLIMALAAAAPAERTRAAEQLAHLAEEAQAAAVQLVNACADDSDDVREWVVSALEDLGPPRAQDLKALAATAEKGSDDQSYWACTLLGRAAEDASEFVATLKRVATNHKAPQVRKRAQWALDKIAGE